MGQIKVLNNRDSRVVISRETRDAKNALHIAEMVLQSGANNVDEAELAEFRKNPSAEHFFASGMLVAEGPVAEPTVEELPAYSGAVDLAKLKIKVALRAIAACNNVLQLRTWIKQDGRPEVRDALIKRHEELTKESQKSE